MKYFSPSLLDGSVTTAKLAAGAVTTVKLDDQAVTNAKIKLGTVDAARLGVNCVRPDKIKTATTSLAGSIPGPGFVDIALTAYCFWPMIHSIQPPDVWVSGHLTDAPGADNPRLSLNNSGVVARTYDVDYRYIQA